MEGRDVVRKVVWPDCKVAGMWDDEHDHHRGQTMQSMALSEHFGSRGPGGRPSNYSIRKSAPKVLDMPRRVFGK